MSSWITYFLYSVLWRFVRLLPERAAYSVFKSIARIAYRRNGSRVRRLRKNYQVVAPDYKDHEIELLVQSGLYSAMRYWCDTFRISDWTSD